MFKRLSNFKIDHLNESHLIIPFSEIDENIVIHSSDKGIIYINAYNNLFVIAEKFDSEIENYINIHKNKIKFAVFPASENPTRYLLKRKECKNNNVYHFVSNKELEEIAQFYQEKSEFDTEFEYLSSLKSNESEFAYLRDDNGNIISSLYTVKKNQLAVNIATKKEERNKGYASLLINSLPFRYIFIEDISLLPFYNHLGFEIVRSYQTWRNKI